MLRIKKRTVRNLFQLKQGLWKRPSSVPAKRDIIGLLESLGLVQLDGINVVDRSHYLVFFSRLGTYRKEHLDELMWSDRKAVEVWAHVASVIPAKYYHCLKPLMESRKAEPLRPGKVKALGGDPDAVFERVRDQIRLRGPLSGRDFPKQDSGKRRWWNKKPERRALELLFRRGELMIGRRVNFEPCYDLPGNVLPGRFRKKSLTWDEWQVWVARRSLAALGVATVSHIADYFRQSASTVENGINYLVKKGEAVEVSTDCWNEPSYMLGGDLEYLDSKCALTPPDATTLLSPFDNLLWHRDRVESLFDFHYRAEMYTPPDMRRYGYFVMPILHRGKLVGRLDPAVDRRKLRLNVHSIHLENGQRVGADLVKSLRRSLENLAVFTGCTGIKIGKSKPSGLRKELAVD